MADRVDITPVSAHPGVSNERPNAPLESCIRAHRTLTSARGSRSDLTERPGAPKARALAKLRYSPWRSYSSASAPLLRPCQSQRRINVDEVSSREARTGGKNDARSPPRSANRWTATAATERNAPAAQPDNGTPITSLLAGCEVASIEGYRIAISARMTSPMGKPLTVVRLRFHSAQQGSGGGSQS